MNCDVCLFFMANWHHFSPGPFYFFLMLFQFLYILNFFHIFGQLPDSGPDGQILSTTKNCGNPAENLIHGMGRLVIERISVTLRSDNV